VFRQQSGFQFFLQAIAFAFDADRDGVMAMIWSPKTSPQLEKGWLDVMIIAPFS